MATSFIKPEVLYSNKFDINKFYIAACKQVFFMKQQVLHLMASVQYLKTSFICGKKLNVKTF